MLKLPLPDDKDVVDMLVLLRNSAAHNGHLSEESLKQYNGGWCIPVLKDKYKLHLLLTKALQYMFCCIVGHTRDKKAILLTAPLELKS